jgi:hypothetical protein
MTDAELTAIYTSYSQQLSINRRFHLFRVSLAAVVLFFVSARYTDLRELAQMREKLVKIVGRHPQSTTITIQSFVARIELGAGSAATRDKTVRLVAEVEALVRSLDGLAETQEAMAGLTLNEFLERSDPSRRELIVKVPYLDQFRLPSAALIYLSFGAFLLMLHERTLLAKTTKLGRVLGGAAPLLEERAVVVNHVRLGFAILGPCDNILALGTWIYLLGVGLGLALHGLTPVGLGHFFVAACLHIAAACVYYMSLQPTVPASQEEIVTQ